MGPRHPSRFVYLSAALAAFLAASAAWAGRGASAQAGHVVINEVLYDPPSGWPEPEAEWVEIYNPTGADVDISGWRISDDPSPDGGDEGAYEFPPGSEIPAGGYVVVAHSAEEFWLRYGVYPHYEMEDTTPAVPSLIEVNPGLQLANSGDDVHLFDSSMVEVDSAWYGTGGDVGAAGAAPDVPEGHSIEREPAGVDTDDCSADFVDRNPPTPLNPVTLTLRAVDSSGSGISGASFKVDGEMWTTGADGSVSRVVSGGVHDVSAPSTAESGGGDFFFLRWGDLYPDDDREVSLAADETLEAVYSDAGIPSLKGRVSSLSTEVRAARSGAEEAAAAAAEVGAALEGVNRSLNSLEREVLRLSSELGDLRFKLASLGELGDLRGEVGNLSASVDGLDLTLGRLNSTVLELRRAVRGLGGNLSDLTARIRRMGSRLDLLEDQVEDLRGKISVERPTWPDVATPLAAAALIAAVISLAASLKRR